ncbi:MAG: hypothetical protein JW982_07320 [Spirochaetes bacterium]|nr:hypothetical protein [Spirochaetota bacterium]
MKHIAKKIFLPLLLVSASFIFYSIHYFIFRDMHHIFLYLVGDIAFIPIEVLLVTLIIHKILNEREKQKMLEKMNMLLGVFFSEAGKELLNIFINSDIHIQIFKTTFSIDPAMNDKDFKKIIFSLKQTRWNADVSKLDIIALAEFLLSKRDFFMKLLENPFLLEHNIFTDLMQSLFHLEDEFTQRMNARNMTDEDVAHIQIDIDRAYNYLLIVWVRYMKYLKNNHPYLFAFATKTNPLAK